MSKYTKCVCKVCDKETIHYSKGMCRPCYARALHHGFTVDELKAWDKAKEEIHSEVVRKKQELIDRINDIKVTTSNEFKIAPRARVSSKVFDWYYNSTDKYLIFDCGDDIKARTSVYNSLYAITKRRHHMNIKRYVRKGIVIVEREVA